MTPSQQTALESLLGRALEQSECDQLDPFVLARNDVQIASMLTAWQTKIRKSIAVEDVYDVLYFSGDYLVLKAAQLAGNALAVMCFSILLDAKQIGPGTVNLDSPQTQGLFAQLKDAELLTQTGIDALNKRASVDAPEIHYNAVSDALNIAEGRMTLG